MTFDFDLESEMGYKLNILFVSNSKGVSGAELIMLDLMKSINKKRYKPLLFCDSVNKSLLDRAEKLNIECITTAKYPDGGKTGTSGITLSKIFAYFHGIINIYFDLSKAIKNKKCDIIYAKAYPCCLFCILPSFILRKPFVWHVFNIRKISIKNWLNYKIAGVFCKKIVTVSNACATNLRKAMIPKHKMITIYNLRDFGKPSEDRNTLSVREELGISGNAKAIGLFAQPIPEKGHEYFIRAAAEVLKIFPESKFLVVGYLYDNEYQKRLYNLIDELKLRNSIIFTGWREDVPDLMSSIDIVAHTRVTPEPAALILIEAMAMGKPVVASNTGGTSELILDKVTGLLVPPKDSLALANAIIELLKDPLKARQLGINGKKRAQENFTLDKHARSFERLFEVIVPQDERKSFLKQELSGNCD